MFAVKNYKKWFFKNIKKFYLLGFLFKYNATFAANTGWIIVLL